MGQISNPHLPLSSARRHDQLRDINLPKHDGTPALVGAPTEPYALNGFGLLFGRGKVAGSMTACDILLTTHPDASNFWERVESRQKAVRSDPMVDTTACQRLADRAEADLQKRIAEETAKEAISENAAR